MIPALPLAGTRVHVPRLGFGCAQLFGGWEKRASARLLETALEAGIRHFDTAPSYAFGSAEPLLGEVLQGVDGVVVTTKCGIPHPPEIRIPGRVLARRQVRRIGARVPGLGYLVQRMRGAPAPYPDGGRAQRHLLSEEIEASLERSRRNLRGRAIDILLVHDADQFVLDDALLDRLERLRREGQFGAFGLCYGRPQPDAPAFGHVVQSAYPPDVSSLAGSMHRQYYGVLRPVRPGEPAHDRLARARSLLLAGSAASLVFTSSDRRHIRQLADLAADR